MDWSEEENAKLEAANDRGCGWPQIAELAVELYRARPTPSGQVAEDVAHVERVLKDRIFQRQTGPEFRAAISRLAAGAQAREQAEAKVSDLERRCGLAADDLNRLNLAYLEMRIERDTARQEAEDWKRKWTEDVNTWSARAAKAEKEAEALRAQLDGARQNEARALEQGGRDQEEIDRLRAEVRQMVAQVAESTRLAEVRLAERNATQAEVEALRADIEATWGATGVPTAVRDITTLATVVSGIKIGRQDATNKVKALRARVAEVEATNAALFEMGERVLALAAHDDACAMMVGSEFTGCSCAVGEWSLMPLAVRSPGAALLAEHAKALVRARNEGLETARKMVHDVGLHNLASLIEVAKEPES